MIGSGRAFRRLGRLRPQAADDDRLILDVLERLRECSGSLSGKRAFLSPAPSIPGAMPCGKKMPTNRVFGAAAARLRQQRSSGNHRLEQRQRQRDSGTTQERPARNCFLGIKTLHVLLSINCPFLLIETRNAAVFAFSYSSGTACSSRCRGRAPRTCCRFLLHHARSSGPAACPGSPRRGRARMSSAFRRHLARTDRNSRSSHLRRPDRSVDLGAVEHRGAPDRPGFRRRAVRHCAIASKFSSEKPIGSIMLWHWIQSARTRWSSIFCAHRRLLRIAGRVRRLAAAAAGRSAADPAGSCRGCSPMIHLPRVTGDVLSGLAVVDRKAPFTEQPPPHVHIRAERHAAELAAVDIRECRSASPAAR